MNTPRKNLNHWIAFTLFACLVFSLGGANAQESAQMMVDSAMVTEKNLHRDDWLGKDKFDHAMVSAGLVAAQFYFFHVEQNWERQSSRKIAVTSTFAMGVAKEIYDSLSGRGTPSWKDLLADIAGIVLAATAFTQ